MTHFNAAHGAICWRMCGFLHSAPSVLCAVVKRQRARTTEPTARSRRTQQKRLLHQATNIVLCNPQVHDRIHKSLQQDAAVTLINTNLFTYLLREAGAFLRG